MKRNVIIGIAGIILALMAAMQVMIDYVDEKELNDNAVKVAKKISYCIFIEIEDKTLYLLQGGKCVKKYSISSGMSGLPSPIGTWKIVDKGDWGEGFGGSWMGFNVPWGRYGIHGTGDEGSIGLASSHGCIRMYNDEAKELYNTVPIGTPVVIVNGSFGPFGQGFANIEPGDRGADVMAIQQRLEELGYFKGRPDGIYGDILKAAVHKFQEDKGLEVKNTITKRDYLAMGFRDFQ